MSEKLIKLYSNKNIPSPISHSSYQKGFTLIELLVVIAILGILAAVLMVALNPAARIAAARNSRVRSDLSSIGSQAMLFNNDTGTNAGCTASYPLTFGSAAVGCTTGITFMAAINDPSGTVYDFEAIPAGTCNMGLIPCTAVSVMGNAYDDDGAGPAVAGVYCWRSATGVITRIDGTYANGDTNCNP